MRVAIVMGSTSDIPKLEPAVEILKNHGVSIEAVRGAYSVLKQIWESYAVETKEESVCKDKLPMAISDFATILSLKYKGDQL